MITAILALLGTVFAVVILVIAIVVLIYNGLVTKRSLVNEDGAGSRCNCVAALIWLKIWSRP